jgi:hypothetical protein
MSRIIWWLIVIFGLGLVGLIFYNAWLKTQPERWEPVPPPVIATPEPASPAEPEIRYPIREEPQEKPLPSLDQSDAAVKEAFGELWGPKTLGQFFLLDEFIRRVVAMIDNLPREKVALRLRPMKQVPGKFAITGKDGGYAADPDNTARYTPYVKLAEAMNTAKIVAFYIRFYPLFQQAYRELGYPKGYFNDRLMEVIDHLLAAPEMRQPVRLVQPKVFYQYADPDLEARSAGQKILMRIGNENAARIKAKLGEIRAELLRQGAPPKQK